MGKEQDVMKKRVLLLQKVLYETTDAEHPLSTFELLDYLGENGIHSYRKTLREDIKLMTSCGMDIVTIHSKPNKYYWGERAFENSELKLLIDAVSSSRFISQNKSRELSRKLISLAITPDRKELRRNIYATNRVKASNEKLMNVIDSINDAITQDSKISFQYQDYTPKKRKILKNEGLIYTLSPYALFWNQDYYYVIGYSEKHEGVSSFRVDRIRNIEILNEKAVTRPADFSLERYSHQIFEMYDGDTVKVKLECNNDIMRYVIDRFGKNVETEIATDTTFYAYPEVALSPNFYSWLFKFAGKIRLLSPDFAKEEYTRKANLIVTDAELKKPNE